MKTYNALFALIVLCTYQSVFAIQQYDIRFKLSETDCENGIVCFDVQLRSADGQGWNLAGQNYRLFYDASVASHRMGTATPLLPLTQYSEVDVAADINSPVDASGFQGDLPFASTLGFLNFSIDLMNLSTGGINLPANGDWVSTVKLCFDVTDALINDPNVCMNAVWGRMDKTDGYATAFVEVSQWLASNSTTEAFANLYNDLDAEDGDEACITILCDENSTGNENTETLCSDGIDNDADGLIDCADPNCSALSICDPIEKRFDVRLDLANVDCVTGQACYDVEIRGLNSSFVVANQDYRLYYNSSRATFINGTSSLGSNYGPLTLLGGTPIENRNATGLGDLPYDSTLGFINFTIELANEVSGAGTTVSSSAFTKTAQLCFDVNSETINDNVTCFEANWARSGVTTGYNPSTLRLREWVSANISQPLIVNSFGNISAASGDKACFDLSCGSNEKGDDQCSDGVDNDNDGLVDCLDPGCGTSNFCKDNCNALAPTITGN